MEYNKGNNNLPTIAKNISNDSTYSITDLAAMGFLKGNLNEGTNTIDINQLYSGVYLFHVGEEKVQWIKIIKK